MIRWEYKLIDSRDVEAKGILSVNASREDLEGYLNSLGSQGWEVIDLDFMVGASGPRHFKGIAKRKLADD